MKWEYAIKNIPLTEQAAVQKELDAAGKEGWELAVFIEKQPTPGALGPPAHLFIFKRQSG